VKSPNVVVEPRQTLTPYQRPKTERAMDVFRLAKPMKNRLFTFFVGLARMGCQHQTDRQPTTVESSASVAEPSDESIQITVHARVDISNSEIREMATLWMTIFKLKQPDKEQPIFN